MGTVLCFDVGSLDDIVNETEDKSFNSNGETVFEIWSIYCDTK